MALILLNKLTKTKLMKNIFYFLFTVIFTNLSCAQKNLNIEKLNSIKDESIISYINKSGERGIPFPSGSKAVRNEDNTFTINLPKDYFYIVVDEKGEFFKINYSGSVTCKCNGGGCSPVAQGGSVYCVMADCSVCVKFSSMKNNTGENVNVEIVGIYQENESSIKFLVDNYSKEPLNKSIEIKKDEIYFKNMISTFEKYKELNNDFMDIYNLIYDNKIPDFILKNADLPNDNYKYVYASVYGNLMLIPVPNTSEFSNFKTAAGASCKCNSGSGCIKKSLLGAKYCDAGDCSSCTLNF